MVICKLKRPLGLALLFTNISRDKSLERTQITLPSINLQKDNMNMVLFTVGNLVWELPEKHKLRHIIWL